MADYNYETGRLQELAMIDKSAEYEVDYTFIGWDKETDKFVLVTASGCSWWDGDCDVEEYDSLEELDKGLCDADRQWYTTLKGAKTLCEVARERWFEIQAKDYGKALLD